MTRPLRVAVVGSGPSGMYAAGHLLEGPGGTYLDGRLQKLVDRPVEVDVFDRLPTQWGLLRHGVAPDHPEKKLVQRVFEVNAARPGFRFFGNVEIGNQVKVQELTEWYDAVVYAMGANGDAQMRLPGEELPGCLSARSFVAWYNGHPDHAELDIDLSHERAVIVGNGNVALDMARILTRPVDDLARTDIAPHALEALRASKVREVVVLGRRAHFHGAFNNPELEELGRLSGVEVRVRHGVLPGELELALDTLDDVTRRKVATLQALVDAPPAGAERRIVLRFLTSPLEVVGTDHVEALLVGHNRLAVNDGRSLEARPTGERELIATGLVLRSIGYFGSPLPGLPFDHRNGTIPNVGGRIVLDGAPLPGAFVTGWAKRGPRGIIGINKKCARDTIRSLMADAGAGSLPTAGTVSAAEVGEILHARQPDLVDHSAWQRIDDLERRAGRALGRPRTKLCDWASLAHAGGVAPTRVTKVDPAMSEPPAQ